MFVMPRSPISQYLFDAFLQWEKDQPGQRSTYSAFANYLGVKQQALNSWMSDRTKPNIESIQSLAQKIGKEIYILAGLEDIDPDLQAITYLWPHLSEEARHIIREQAEKYVTGNETASAARPSENHP